jgi:hypothetical protein
MTKIVEYLTLKLHILGWVLPRCFQSFRVNASSAFETKYPLIFPSSITPNGPLIIFLATILANIFWTSTIYLRKQKEVISNSSNSDGKKAEESKN